MIRLFPSGIAWPSVNSNKLTVPPIFSSSLLLPYFFAELDEIDGVDDGLMTMTMMMNAVIRCCVLLPVVCLSV